VSAVEAAYAAFAGYRLPPVMTFCDVCWTPDQEAALHGPLREIPDDLVQEYASGAVWDIGDAAAVRHFAPRLLDAAARNPLGASAFLRPFPEAGAASWPAAERAAVRAVLDEVWERTLATYGPGYDTEPVLCAYALAGYDLAPVLAAWGARTDVTAVAQVAGLVVDHPATVLEGAPLRDPYWPPEPMGLVAGWLRDPARRDQVAAPDIAPDNEPYASLLEVAASVLAGVR
jgi:hypothetical protein